MIGKFTKDCFRIYVRFSYCLLLCRGCDPRKKIPFKVIEVMLRLPGNKYDIHQLIAEATGRLHVEFPTTLYHWDRRWVGVQKFIFKGIKEQNGLLFDIINLALEYGLLSILPVTYFLCLGDIVGLQDSCCRIVSHAFLSLGLLGRHTGW
jgi:hypothetical protein